MSGGEKSQIYFEGVERVLAEFVEGGYSQVAAAIDTSIPLDDQKRIANSYIKIIFLSRTRAYRYHMNEIT